MPALLNRILGRAETEPSVGMVAYGPRCTISGGRLAIDSGPLAGTTMRVERSISRTRADFSLYESAASLSIAEQRFPDPLAHCHFDRNPETGTETLLSIFIRSEFRHRGLTTLLVRFSFRELLHSGNRHWFAIRKLMQVDTEGRNQAQVPGTSKAETPPLSRISLHNVGIGLVALRLGFRPEPALERLLAPGNVRAVQAIPADPPSPPGLLLRLGTLPALLVAALVDPETGRPIADAEAYQHFVNPKQLLRQALAGEAVIGNIDYVLSTTAIERLAARLANDQAELKRFAATLRRGPELMPTKLRLEAYRSLEISIATLSPAFGCGQMLHALPRLNASEPLHNTMSNYGYENMFADKAAQKMIENPGLLKQFYDSAFTNKTPLRQNFRNVYGQIEVYLAIDATAKTAWFVADPNNRVAFVNYYRDAVSLGLKPLGVLLIGSIVRITPAGWQNLFDLLTDKFFNANPGIHRIEIMGVLDGVRWRANTLGLGVTLLNFRELPEIVAAVGAALRGPTGPEIQH